MAMPPSTPRFNLLPKSLEEMINDEENENTKGKTPRDLGLFKEFLSIKGEQLNVEDISRIQLNYLAGFIFRVKRRDGNEYEPSSIRGIIASIQRYINSKNCGFSIFKDSAFARTQAAMKAKGKQLKKQGMGEKPYEADALTDEELDILYTNKLMGRYSPESVINTLWYNNCYYFGMRDCQAQENVSCGGEMYLS